jgi:hypothetical protein
MEISTGEFLGNTTKYFEEKIRPHIEENNPARAFRAFVNLYLEVQSHVDDEIRLNSWGPCSFRADSLYRDFRAGKRDLKGLDELGDMLARAEAESVLSVDE